MSFINPNDMVEEDAADLQFPKEPGILTVTPSATTEISTKHLKANHPLLSNFNDKSENCCTCLCILQEPYIECAECKIVICVECFSLGSETNVHRNTHPYIIRHDNIHVFATSNWTASEERKLLNLLLSCGYGNWDDVAKEMNTRTANECCEHYHNYYFGGIFEKVLGLASDPYVSLNTPFVYKMKSVDPPRHELDSLSFQNMSGYRCARGDFDEPYDNSAESIISDLEVNDYNEVDSLENELLCAVVLSYNRRLLERKRRYKIMRQHGLLVTSKTLGWLSKYSEAIGTAQIPGKFIRSGRFIAFMQITNAITFDSLIESMQYFYDLKTYLFKLHEMRANGIRTFAGGKLYQKLKSKRSHKTRDRRLEQFENSLDWRNLVTNCDQLSSKPFYHMNPSVLLPRRKAAPLEILGLSGYDKLTEDERNLCSVSRIVPAAYLEYKNTLTSENSRAGYLRLADARRLIKIDVNKTRQLYDFLLKHGFVNKPLHS